MPGSIGEGWGLPMGAVLATVAVWYHGDGLYNDYEMYRLTIGDDALGAAWWQVLLFVVTFSFLGETSSRGGKSAIFEAQQSFAHLCNIG